MSILLEVIALKRCANSLTARTPWESCCAVRTKWSRGRTSPVFIVGAREPVFGAGRAGSWGGVAPDGLIAG